MFAENRFLKIQFNRMFNTYYMFNSIFIFIRSDSLFAFCLIFSWRSAYLREREIEIIGMHRDFFTWFTIGFSVIWANFDEKYNLILYDGIQTSTEIPRHRHRMWPARFSSQKQPQETGNWLCLISFKMIWMHVCVCASFLFSVCRFAKVCLFASVLSLQIRSKWFSVLWLLPQHIMFSFVFHLCFGGLLFTLTVDLFDKVCMQEVKTLYSKANC